MAHRGAKSWANARIPGKKNPLSLRQSGMSLALAAFVKRPQAEIKSALII